MRIRQVTRAELVSEEIEAIVALVPEAATFRCLIREPLARVWQAPAGKAEPWPLLPLFVCEAVRGEYESAIPAAAAMQFLMAAADVFDDIEDVDSPGSLPARHGPAIATNVAAVLLVLAERAIGRLDLRGVESLVIVRVMDAVNSYYTAACAGQHMDLSLDPGAAVSEEDYLRVAEMKSASTVECACHIGALVATTNRDLIDNLTLFGHNLGIAAQIANDIRGIIKGSDIEKRKVTLPAIYALSWLEGKPRRILETLYCRREQPVNVEEVRNLLFETGAVHYAAVKMEFYRWQALDCLVQAERAGAGLAPLRPFLEVA